MSFCLLFVTGEQTISHTQVRGGQKNCLSTGDKHFSHTAGGDKHFLQIGRGKHFSDNNDNCRECERSKHYVKQSQEATCRV